MDFQHLAWTTTTLFDYTAIFSKLDQHLIWKSSIRSKQGPGQDQVLVLVLVNKIRQRL